MPGLSQKAATAAFLVTAAAVMAELLRRAMAAGPIGPADGSQKSGTHSSCAALRQS